MDMIDEYCFSITINLSSFFLFTGANASRILVWIVGIIYWQWLPLSLPLGGFAIGGSIAIARTTAITLLQGANTLTVTGHTGF